MKHKPVVAALLLFAPLTACGSAQAGDSSTVTVTVGYQSKTINTVTAGTLLRSLGSFEKQLNSSTTATPTRSTGRTTPPAPPSPPR